MEIARAMQARTQTHMLDGALEKLGNEVFVMIQFIRLIIPYGM